MQMWYPEKELCAKKIGCGGRINVAEDIFKGRKLKVRLQKIELNVKRRLVQL
jgi:hypothetical protein